MQNQGILKISLSVEQQFIALNNVVPDSFLKSRVLVIYSASISHLYV